MESNESMEMTVVMMMVPVVIHAKALQEWVAGHKHAPPESPKKIRNHEARTAAAGQQRIIIRAVFTPMVMLVMRMMPHGPGFKQSHKPCKIIRFSLICDQIQF